MPPLMQATAKTSGAQSARRLLELLRLIGAHAPEGIRLRELIEVSGLERSTAHRLLSCLVEEQFIERDEATRRYHLGIEVMQLGISATAGRVSLVERCRPGMLRLARQTGDTVFLIVRSGDFALCLHREAGSYPIKVFTVEPGSRRLLGLSAVGVSIMAGWPEDAVAGTWSRHAAEYEKSGMPLPLLLEAVVRTREAGYSHMSDLRTQETSGIGCAFTLASGLNAGLSVSAIKSRMGAQRRAEVAALIRSEIGLLTDGHAG